MEIIEIRLILRTFTPAAARLVPIGDIHRTPSRNERILFTEAVPDTATEGDFAATYSRADIELRNRLIQRDGELFWLRGGALFRPQGDRVQEVYIIEMQHTSGWIAVMSPPGQLILDLKFPDRTNTGLLFADEGNFL